MTDKNPEKQAPEDQHSAADPAHPELDASRRAALLRMSGYAASVAPAMLVLMNGKTHAKPGNGNGNGNGPACDNPAWDLGLKRAGHSGC